MYMYMYMYMYLHIHIHIHICISVLMELGILWKVQPVMLIELRISPIGWLYMLTTVLMDIHRLPVIVHRNLTSSHLKNRLHISLPALFKMFKICLALESEEWRVKGRFQPWSSWVPDFETQLGQSAGICWCSCGDITSMRSGVLPSWTARPGGFSTLPRMFGQTMFAQWARGGWSANVSLKYLLNSFVHLGPHLIRDADWCLINECLVWDKESSVGSCDFKVCLSSLGWDLVHRWGLGPDWVFTDSTSPAFRRLPGIQNNWDFTEMGHL